MIQPLRLRLLPLARLVLRDLWHERILAICTASVLAATMAPLGVLWGLERGVIGALIARMDGDPVMRLLVPESTGRGHFDQAWFQRVSSWPEVSFVVPAVRSAASLVELVSPSAPAPVVIELHATGKGDPLLGDAEVPRANGLVLSAEAARKLAAQPGTEMLLPMRRQREQRDEAFDMRVRVSAVLPLSVSDGTHALVDPSLVDSIESWRDGWTVADFFPEGNGSPPRRQAHALFRMYARSIRDVPLLAERLEKEGNSARTREREISQTLGLQRNLRAVLLLVGTASAGGVMAAIFALQVSTLARKRRDYALLTLTGHGRSWLLAATVGSSLVVGLAGSLFALALYGAGAAVVNLYFQGQLASGEAAVRLAFADVVTGVAAALALLGVPALWASWRSSNVEAADALREE